MNAHMRDLRRACLHEFAHREVARLLGVNGHVRIDRNPHGGIEEFHFSGCFHLSHGADARSLRLIALAGCVAEHLDDDHHFEGWQLIEALDAGEVGLSATDANLAGDFDEQDVDESAGLVLQAWESIERAAEFEARCWSEATR